MFLEQVPGATLDCPQLAYRQIKPRLVHGLVGEQLTHGSTLRAGKVNPYINF